MVVIRLRLMLLYHKKLKFNYIFIPLKDYTSDKMSWWKKKKEHHVNTSSNHVVIQQDILMVRRELRARERSLRLSETNCLREKQRLEKRSAELDRREAINEKWEREIYKREKEVNKQISKYNNGEIDRQKRAIQIPCTTYEDAYQYNLAQVRLNNKMYEKSYMPYKN